MEKLTKQQKIVGLLVILVLLILATNFIRSTQNNGSGINYNNATGEELLKKSTRNYDRVIFAELEDIVTQFVGSYIVPPDSSEEQRKDFVSYEKYSNALEAGYKKYLGLNYKKQAESFLDNFVANAEEAPQMHTMQILREVYTVSDNEYLCILSNGYEGKKSYLGIILVPSTNNWEIFYIE